MRKKVVAVFLIVIVLIAAAFYPVKQNSTITINATFDNTFLQVMHIENWKNWYPDIRNAYEDHPGAYHISPDNSKKNYSIAIPGKKLSIHVITPMVYNVTETGNNSVNTFAFTVFPGEEHGQMKIFFERKVPLIFTLFNKNDSDNNPLQGLKNYLETPEEFYGYNIKMSEIKDPIIASLVFKSLQNDIFIKMPKKREELVNYIKKNNLQKTGYISVSYIPLLHDSIQITVGIPVDKIATPDQEIKCLSLPAKGRVLVADYKGIFSDRQKVYQAMTKYLTDHTLSIPAESFERYLNDSLPTSDSSQINMQLNFPVY